MQIQTIENHFPQGIALGAAFLGRDEAIKWLSDNIKSNHHTLLLAPRRYGKTSLALNTLNKLKLPYIELDLYLAVSSKYVEKKILSAVSSLIKSTAGKNEQILKIVQDFFKKRKAKWTLGFKGIVGVELEPDDENDPPENILTALTLLDDVLAKKNKRAVIFIDEFQEIHSLDAGQQIQGAIRHFAQNSSHLTLIFSGSNRRMLSYMFGDKSQPMYEVCDRIVLDRISSVDYQRYINKVALKTWGCKLSEEAVSTITTISELHPKRIYNLCYYLWRRHAEKQQAPGSSDVIAAWKYFIKQRLKDTRHQLSSLSAGQLKVLSLIASSQVEEMSGKKAQQLTNMASSSIIKALDKLELNDFIEKNEGNKYRVIDPLVGYIIEQYEAYNLC